MIGQLTIGESIDFLQALEAKHDLLGHRLAGWSVWCVLRFPLQLALVTPHTVPAARMSHRARLALSLTDAGRLLRPGRSRYVVKTYSSGLVEREGERYKDIWFDDLIKEIGGVFKIEQVNSPMFLSRRAQALFPSDVTTSGMELAASALARIWRPTRLAETARVLSRILAEEVGPNVFPEEWIARRLRLFLAGKALYRRLLERVRPSFLLVADPGEHASVAAAKELGVTSIELQHGGTTDRYHSGYCWTSYGIPHRRTMPIPDRLFLYGEHTRREIDGHGFWGESIRVVGCPRVDQYRTRRSEPAPGGPRVLLTTGASIAATITFMAEFLRASRHVPGLELWVKLHPIYEGSPDAYLEAFRGDSRVRVFSGNEDPSTFELLSRASVHVSVSSSCHYDALGLGVPTVILPLPTHEIVLPLHQAGHALLAPTAADLARIVAGWPDLRVSPMVSGYFFRPHAIRNMREDLGLAGHGRDAAR
jgi:hypothetical protein